MKRIAIIGCAGSGKTTLAKKLGMRFDIPIYHLDYYYWKPGWVESDPEEFKKTHQMLIDQPSWIIDGNQVNTIADRLSIADVIIFLDKPTLLCLWRVLFRWIKNIFRRTKGLQSTMTWGLLAYVWRYNRVYRPMIIDLLKQHAANDKKIVLFSNEQVKYRKLEKYLAQYFQ